MVKKFTQFKVKLRFRFKLGRPRKSKLSGWPCMTGYFEVKTITWLE